MEADMFRFNTLFVLLMVLCVGTIYIVEAYTDLQEAKNQLLLRQLSNER